MGNQRRSVRSHLYFPLIQIPLLSTSYPKTPPPYNPQQKPENNEADLETPLSSSRSSPPTASPVASRLRGKREPSPPDSTSQAFPLRQGNDGQFQYWPFSASDLYNWKQHNPPFSKDPMALHRSPLTGPAAGTTRGLEAPGSSLPRQPQPASSAPSIPDWRHCLGP
ncbi:Gag-Pol polyprotein [Lemmus lemmus]